MKGEAFKQLIRSIFEAKDAEILCSEFFGLLPHFVEVQLLGQDAAALLPDVSHHLRQCPECDEVYQALLLAAGSGEPTENT